jgi:flagellar basal-body rod protein FlgB
MNADGLPLLTLVKSRMSYLGARQRVLAENIANAPTPKYVPRDIAAPSFKALMSGQTTTGLVRTNPHHLTGSASGTAGGGRFKTIAAPDTETTLDGNAVVLEDQMVKLSQTRADFDLAVGIYQKSMALLRTATRRPGG